MSILRGKCPLVCQEAVMKFYTFPRVSDAYMHVQMVLCILRTQVRRARVISNAGSTHGLDL